MDNTTAEFRPPASLRYLLAVAGLACLPAALYQIWSGLSNGDPRRIIGGILFLLPGAVAFAAWRRLVVAREDMLSSGTLLRRRNIPWTRVVRLDQTRSSFTVETELGPVSAGWIAAKDRETLLRLVIERANLRPSQYEPRWGLIARYVPRSQEIQFVPHHARRPKLEDKQ